MLHGMNPVLAGVLLVMVGMLLVYVLAMVSIIGMELFFLLGLQGLGLVGTYLAVFWLLVRGDQKSAPG